MLGLYEIKVLNEQSLCAVMSLICTRKGNSVLEVGAGIGLTTKNLLIYFDHVDVEEPVEKSMDML